MVNSTHIIYMMNKLLHVAKGNLPRLACFLADHGKVKEMLG